MSDRPSTEADRLFQAGVHMVGRASLATEALRDMNYGGAFRHLEPLVKELAEVLMGVRFQTGDGVVMCEHCEKCVEEDEAVEDHVAQCWWCIPCSEAAIERSRH